MPFVSRRALPFALLALAACSSGSDRGAARPASSALLHPSDSLPPRAADTVRVRVETSKGPFVIEAYREWAPRGVDRFAQLVNLHFYDGVRFFRVIEGFMAQFGASGDPKIAAAWEDKSIPDDSVRQSNVRGTVSFATKGPNTRTTQLFINLVDNKNLDGMGFSPIGRVVEGMSVVDSLYAGYGEGYPQGNGPDQGQIAEQGNAYLQRMFPRLDSIVSMRVITGGATASAPPSTDSAAKKAH